MLFLLGDMLLHEVTESSGGVRFKITDGFTKKWPTGFTRREIESGSSTSSLQENQEEKKRQKRWEKKKRQESMMLCFEHGASFSLSLSLSLMLSLPLRLGIGLLLKKGASVCKRGF